MRFDDIPVEIFSVRIKSTDGSSLGRYFSDASPSRSVALVVPSETTGSFDIAVDGSMVTVAPTTDAGARRLNGQLSAGRAMLAQLSDLAMDDSAELRIAFFIGTVIDMGSVEIGVDEYVEKGVNKLARGKVRDVYAWLDDHCTLRLGEQTYFFLAAGPAIEDALSERPEDDAAKVKHERVRGSEVPATLPKNDLRPSTLDAIRPNTTPTLDNSFCVTGSDMRFVSTATSLPGGASIYVATKLTARKFAADKTIRLARGHLAFCDWTKTGKIQLLAESQLSALTSQESSYLRKWDEFGDLEGEIFLNRAREIGALEYTNPVANLDGTVSVRIIAASPAALEALSTGQLQELDPVDEVPEYVSNTELSFSDFSQSLVRHYETAPLGGRGRGNGRIDGSERLEVARYDRETRTLTLKIESLSQVGTLVMSTAGEIAQIRRRESARRHILHGKSANPQLGLLIGEKGEITALRSPQRVKPLSAFVRAKVFGNPPTERQELAIDVALNTPDIALIQGPPGTGKTTVIAAILERLNELSSQDGTNTQGQILLSGFQHDAVENMIDRISLNGIPVPKFGRRPGSDDADLNSFERSLEEWCLKVARELRKKNPQIAELEEESAIRDLYRQYLRTPSHKIAATLVTRIAAMNVDVLGEKVSRRAIILSKRLATEETLKAGQRRHVLAVQRLRTRPESFADDGPDRAEDALVDLEGVLDEEQRALLDKACDWHSDRGIPPLLEDLAGLKHSLLAALTAPLDFRVEKHNDDVIRLVESAIKRVNQRGATATDKKAAALAAFLSELENNPLGMVDAVSSYSYAYSATVQQSVNKEMQRRKGITKGDGNEILEYEYVIIDEAARVSPRDLMIPMAQGKKIILVGDHRQLPHIIDEEVARQMEAGEDDSGESEWLKKSMFQYLFSERLKTLEERDGITRRVTLDKQFRMHPELGNFVSRNFYERFDPTERFESGLPPEAFTHHLPGTDGAPAIWLDVPNSEGAAKRQRTSWIRQAEVAAIARQLKDWQGTPEGSELSYGVISFYKAQADLIRKELQRRPNSCGIDHRKIRIGTVDSFQGMEFDVVFLSIVRTIPHAWRPQDQDRARQARTLFGHLGLYNRLNVSMSRQKKLLVAVGDSALVRNDLASDFIPGLVDFHQLANRRAGERR